MHIYIGRFLASAFILVVLTLQAVVGLTYHGGSRWPFISYPMYAGARHEGDRLNDYTLMAVARDGIEQAVDPARLGMAFWIFRKNVVAPILIDGDASEIAAITGQICEDAGRDLVRLVVYDTGIVVGRNGPVHETPAPRASIDISCDI